jgi:cytoskeletal protein CcmA (bactofilin family)
MFGVGVRRIAEGEKMSFFGRRSEEPIADSWQSVEEMTPRSAEPAPSDVYLVEAEDEARNGRIGKGSRVIGTLRFEGSVRIYGEVEGEIVAGDAVIVRRGGRVAGEIRASRVVIEGDATIDVFAGDRVELGATGRLVGNIVSPRLVMHEGAVFEGTSAVGEPASAPAVAAERPGNDEVSVGEALPLAS